MGEEGLGQWPPIPRWRRPSGVVESVLNSSKIQFVWTLNQLEMVVILDASNGSCS